MGFPTNPIILIKYLQRVLEQYKGFAVFRELLQNADDAKATSLHFGWVKPLTEATHPLLKESPSLFILNNGPFTESNAHSIAQLGLSDKAGEVGPIGKFGLGLKSIFHFGEVYFYLSSSTFQSNRVKANDIQNPWSSGKDPETDLRTEWDGFEPSDQDLLRRKINKLLPNSDWFCLWVPLRRRSHYLSEEELRIALEYPGDSKTEYPYIFPSSFEREVARLVPFLRNLEEIQCLAETDGGEIQKVSGILVKRNRVSSGSEADDPADQKTLTGRVKLELHKSQHSWVDFSGVEIDSKNVRFKELSDRPDWPTTIAPKAPGVKKAKPTSIREPAIAEAAACFIREPIAEGEGKLEMTWACYLPVQNPKLSEVPLAAPYNIRLMLHGRFFSDAGRVAIEFEKEKSADNETLSQQWNKLLRDEGTLKLVVPALAEFAKNLDSDERNDVLLALTTALRDSKLFAEYRAAICKYDQWGYLHQATGSYWGNVKSGSTLCEIARPRDGEPALDVVFPALGDICKKSLSVIYQGVPALLQNDSPHAWPEEKIQDLLESVKPTDVFTNPDQLALFVRVAQSVVPQAPTPAIVERMIEIARQGMKALGLAEVMKNQEQISRFLDLIPPNKKVRINCNSNPTPDECRLFKPLWDTGKSVLLTPIGTADTSGKPSDEEKLRILMALHDMDPGEHKEDFFNYRALIACRIIGNPDPNSPQVPAAMNDLRIFPVQLGSSSSITLVSRARLLKAKENGRLHVDTHGFGKALLDVLHDREQTDFLPVARPIADALFGKGAVWECTHLVCAKVLSGAPLLTQDLKPREKLLEKMVEAGRPEQIELIGRSLRYLIHAMPDKIDDDGHLLYEDGQKTLRVWETLTRIALTQTGGNWRLVERSLAMKLHPSQQSMLNIKQFNRSAAGELLSEVGAEKLDLSTLPEDEIRALIKFCDESEYGLIKQLRIHKTINGQRVSIDDTCYWEADFEIDPGLAASVTILQLDKDRVTAAQQKAILQDSLDAAGVIRLILDLDDPHTHWKTILRALGQLTFVPSKLSDALKKTRWIKSTHGRHITPEQIIHSQSLNEAIREVLAQQEDPAIVSILDLPEEFRKNKVFMGLLPDTPQTLKKVGEFLAKDSRFRIGKDDATLSSLRLGFADVSLDVMPCFALLQQQDKLGSRKENLDISIENNLLPPLLADGISSNRLTALLKYLAEKHKTRPAKPIELETYFEWYRRYFETAAGMDEFRAILVDIPVPNAKGGWKTAQELTTSTSSVDLAYQIHPDLAMLLPSFASLTVASVGGFGLDTDASLPTRPINEVQLDRDINAGAKALGDYLEEWARVPGVPREILGGLIALLGDAEPIYKLATYFLGKVDIKSLRARLKWDPSPPYTVTINGKKIIKGGNGKTLENR